MKTILMIILTTGLTSAIGFSLGVKLYHIQEKRKKKGINNK